MQQSAQPAALPETELARGFTIGDWSVKPLAGLISRNGHQAHLEPKVMDVLVCLARHQGEVVTRDMLLTEVWGRVVVSDDAITRCISELRTVLGDTGRERTCIRTIPRRGYSLIVPVAPLDGRNGNGTSGGVSVTAGTHGTYAVPAPAGELVFRSHWKPGPGGRRLLAAALLIALAIPVLILSVGRDHPGAVQTEASVLPESGPDDSVTVSADGRAVDEIKSIAVLPFVNLSGIPENDLFSDGLAEDIRNALLTHTGLRVAAQTSSSVFKNRPMDVREIAAQLNVDALLEGTLRTSDGRLRVTTALTRASNGYAMWAGSYERDLADKVRLQTEVAEEIVRQLAPSVANEQNLVTAATANVQAQDYYLLGRHHWHQRTPESLDKAVEYFQQALALDPNYALAHSGLADALVFQTSYGKRKLDEVEDLARASVNKALELDPSLAEAHASQGILLEHLNEPRAAREAYQRAVDLRPQYSMAQMWLGNAWLYDMDIRRAHEHYTEALKVDPLHVTVQYNYAQSLMRFGRYDEALKTLGRFSDLTASGNLLKAQASAKLALGRYDEVLSLAVGHSFTGEYKPYASEIVIETLIQLQRFDEAGQMIEDNAGAMEPMWRTWLRASLAVVSRDPEALTRVADEILAPGFEAGDETECAPALGAYLHGLASYIAGNYTAADARFSELDRTGFRDRCVKSEPELLVAALIYHGAARLRLDPSDAGARQLFSDARARLDSLKSGGWKTVELSTVDTALRLMSGDEAGARAVVAGMVADGWQPFGLMRSSPLFDDFLQPGRLPEEWVSLDRAFREVQAESETISLAKLGL